MSKADSHLKQIRWKLFLLGLFKIPMIGFVRPRLIELDEQHVSVRIKIRRKTKNHLNSMYFGALAVGADIAAGIHAFYFSEKLRRRFSISFKDFQGDFLQRAESDIVFRSEQGDLVKKAMLESIDSSERVNQPINVSAWNDKNEEVARFTLTVSVRVKP